MLELGLEQAPTPTAASVSNPVSMSGVAAEFRGVFMEFPDLSGRLQVQNTNSAFSICNAPNKLWERCG